MDSGARLTPAKKRDRSTVPTVAFIVSCVLAAYGFKTDNAFLMWILPAILIAAAIAYAFVSGRGKGDSGRST